MVAEFASLACAASVPADLSDLTRPTPSSTASGTLGPVDVLVNNAGVESIGAFTSYTRDELTSIVDVNLTAPLLLTHRLTPGMLSAAGASRLRLLCRRQGGPAFNEPYAATKAGLIGLTQSLRAEYLHDRLGFSVVCPGFIAGDGMYARMATDGHRSNRMMGETSTDRVADAVVRAIREDRPELIESGVPLRPVLALAQLFPGLVERVAPRFGSPTCSAASPYRAGVRIGC